MSDDVGMTNTTILNSGWCVQWTNTDVSAKFQTALMPSGNEAEQNLRDTIDHYALDPATDGQYHVMYVADAMEGTEPVYCRTFTLD